ncbi:MAG: hypothetical protein ACWGNO_07240, partial [Desulfobacterales bacterium]
EFNKGNKSASLEERFTPSALRFKSTLGFALRATTQQVVRGAFHFKSIPLAAGFDATGSNMKSR